MLSTGSPQGCVLSPLLLTQLTHNSAATQERIQIIMFADDTTVVELIWGNEESVLGDEVKHPRGLVQRAQPAAQRGQNQGDEHRLLEVTT